MLIESKIVAAKNWVLYRKAGFDYLLAIAAFICNKSYDCYVVLAGETDILRECSCYE